jgi:hypothetical protein
LQCGFRKKSDPNRQPAPTTKPLVEGRIRIEIRIGIRIEIRIAPTPERAPRGADATEFRVGSTSPPLPAVAPLRALPQAVRAGLLGPPTCPRAGPGTVGQGPERAPRAESENRSGGAAGAEARSGPLTNRAWSGTQLPPPPAPSRDSLATTRQLPSREGVQLSGKVRNGAGSLVACPGLRASAPLTPLAGTRCHCCPRWAVRRYGLLLCPPYLRRRRTPR